MTEEQAFLAALDLPDAAARAAYLDEACGEDAAFRRQVEALLAAHFKSGEFLDVPAAEQGQAGSRDDNTVAHEGDAVLRRRPSERGERADDNTVAHEGDAVSAEKDHEDEYDGLPFLTPSTRPDSLGRLGHYEVLQVLGKGGFGIVFRAFDETLQRVVAIKVMAPQIATLSPARKRFVREARSSAAVRHENVVQVYEVVEHPMPYLVMEFIPGETLQQRLDRTGPLDVSEVLRIGRQIAEGLAAAHANDLIHRDIKPANVLIEGGPQQRAKITDFGLARAADDASISQSGVIAGTPMFMAPEQALGHKIDQRADLFSLGSVLYQMASGRPPFRASSALAVLKRVAEEPPRPIPEIIPETPAWLCGIIAKLHAKNPDERYQSAREVADVLADCEAQLKANARVKDFSRIPRGKPRRSGRWKWATAALVLLALAGVGLFAMTRPRPNSGGPGTEPPRSVAVAWGEVTDPLGDCRFTEENGRLTITAPGDRLHDLNPLPGCNLNSPRVLREVAGDFEARVTVLPYPRPTSLYSTGPHPAYVGAGLVVWSDEAGILRLFRADSGESFVTAEWYNGLTLGGQKWIPVPEGPLHLRIRRTGDTLHLAYSTDGQTWTEVATATNLRPVSRVRVGVAVVNAIKQEFTVQFEGFEIKELPPSSLPPSVRTESGAKDKPSSPAIAPFTDADVQRIAALPAEQQVEEVRKELMRRNPGFDGKMETKIEDGAVTEFRIVTDQVTDIAPIRVFNALRVLECRGKFTYKSGGLLTDLTPLKGMNLADLTCLNLRDTKVSDAGMVYFKDCKDLINLDLSNTKVTDRGLAHFKNCKNLTELYLFDTQISDAGLANFKDCKNLTELYLFSTQISDAGLANFKDCKSLTSLQLGDTRVSDAGLIHFKDCKALTHLYVGTTKVSDAGLAHLKGMPLRLLWIDNIAISDLTPLQGMPLEEIRLTPKNITRGLDILRDMKSLKTIGVEYDQAWPAAEFWQRYDKGEFKSGAPSPEAKTPPPAVAPFTDADVQRIAALPAPEQVKEVRKELLRRNPGFDGTLTPTIDNGVVTGLQFLTDDVDDVSPVRALTSLQALRCNGSGGRQGRLSDLSPLKGMPLTELHCDYTNVSDLSPLKGMPLTVLNCGVTKVSDLSPLKDMKLTYLSCGQDAPVSDLSPLKGMPLTKLYCDYTKASDLSPLRGMPLTILGCDNTKVSDLTPLKGLPLEHISLTPKNVTEGLEILRAMKSLKTIGIDFNDAWPAAEFWERYDKGKFKE